MYSTSCVTADRFGLARGPEPIYFCLTEVPSEADLTGVDLLLEEAEETMGPDVWDWGLEVTTGAGLAATLY